MLCYKFNIPRGTYESRLKSLNMVSLYHRRLFIDELFLYKIVSQKIKTNLIGNFTVHIPNRTTRFTPVFYLPAVTSNVEFFSLVLRLKRQHNENFSNIDLLGNSLAFTKHNIIKSLPQEMRHNFK